MARQGLSDDPRQAFGKDDLRNLTHRLGFVQIESIRAVFCHVERHMNQPQWSDLGMFLQTFMLLLQEAGLDSCAQEAWSLHHKSVDAFVGVEENWMLFCGLAIGKADPDHIVNTLETERASLDDWFTVI